MRPDATPPASASAWEDGFLEVHDRPLEEVIAALRAYRPGLLRVSAAAGRLRGRVVAAHDEGGSHPEIHYKHRIGTFYGTLEADLGERTTVNLALEQSRTRAHDFPRDNLSATLRYPF